MATNEQNLRGEAGPGGTAREFERAVPPVEQPEVTIAPVYEAPEEAFRRRTFLESFTRAAGHYSGSAVRAYRTIRQEGAGDRAKRMVREHPSSLAVAAAAGYLLGRVLRRR
ncbi:MAG: hypothetical protein ACM3S5_04275 [Rhodospirillales bacterium]